MLGLDDLALGLRGSRGAARASTGRPARGARRRARARASPRQRRAQAEAFGLPPAAAASRCTSSTPATASRPSRALTVRAEPLARRAASGARAGASRAAATASRCRDRPAPTPMRWPRTARAPTSGCTRRVYGASLEQASPRARAEGIDALCARPRCTRSSRTSARSPPRRRAQRRARAAAPAASLRVAVRERDRGRRLPRSRARARRRGPAHTLIPGVSREPGSSSNGGASGSSGGGSSLGGSGRSSGARSPRKRRRCSAKYASPGASAMRLVDRRDGVVAAPELEVHLGQRVEQVGVLARRRAHGATRQLERERELVVRRLCRGRDRPRIVVEQQDRRRTVFEQRRAAPGGRRPGSSRP